MFNSRNEQTETKLFKKVVLSILIVPKSNLTNIVKSVILLLKSHFWAWAIHRFCLWSKLCRFPNQIKIGRWPFRKTVYGPAPRNTTIEELSYADTFIINGWLKITPMIYID
jgi:hypothetical protein